MPLFIVYHESGEVIHHPPDARVPLHRERWRMVTGRDKVDAWKRYQVMKILKGDAKASGSGRSEVAQGHHAEVATPPVRSPEEAGIIAGAPKEIDHLSSVACHVSPAALPTVPGILQAAKRLSDSIELVLSISEGKKITVSREKLADMFADADYIHTVLEDSK